MLDQFIVFTKYGLVLFKYELVKVKGDPIGNMIRTVLLESKATTERAFIHGGCSVKWVQNNKFGFVAAAIYQTMLAPNYVDDLLKAVESNICKRGEDLQTITKLEGYDVTFDKLLRGAENKNRGGKTVETKEEEEDGKGEGEGEGGVVEPGKGEADEFAQFARVSRKNRVPGGYKGKKGGRNTPSPTSKKKEHWNSKKTLTKEEEAALDVTGQVESASAEEMEEIYAKKAAKYLPDEANEKADIDKDEDTDEEGDDDDEGGWLPTKVVDFFSSLTGQKALTREDLGPSLEAMEKQLLSKNVSSIATREIIEAVAQDLMGKKLGSFTKGMATAVRESCHRALQRLLTPKRSTDILREAKVAKDEGRPYTIVFIGVNGVGKSTSLSKVTYYLKNNGLKPLLCACDTFRSGAVEQLKVHARNLDVPLFEQGYNKDAASVAINGVKHAKENDMDVVLIDTAGRMQNNEPLMRSLTKLIAKNRPDLILFVGEALVGNDGTDQLILFDKALADYSDSANPRTIDGMILTKFDTIDDKVGAAVSMVHTTGQPIVFVGTGQKYTNLNRLNVAKVLRSLLS